MVTNALEIACAKTWYQGSMEWCCGSGPPRIVRFDAHAAVATICPRIGPIANANSPLVASHRLITRGSEVCMEETTNVMQRQSPRISLTIYPSCQNSLHYQESKVAEASGFIEHSKEFRFYIQWQSGCLLLYGAWILAYHYHWLALK